MINLIKKGINFLRRFIGKVLTEIQKANHYRRLDHDYWVSLKGKYKGRRGFVIGNGPSLKAEDLDKIQQEISIASNKIYLIFPHTFWRPTIFTIADKILWPKINGEIEDRFSKIHVPNYLNSNGINNIRYWKSPLSLGKRKCSINIEEGAYGGHTVTYENLQIAMHLGLNPIYLIGCDHNYKGEKNITAGIVIKQGEEQSHFIKNYRKQGEIVLPASISEMEESYRCARAVAELNNIEIYNATRGGGLEVFERKNIDGLFSS